MNALISSIQRFCLHDGPGIRTTVFFQGCPLQCAWCANPETQNLSSVMMHNPITCIGCGACVSVCPEQAIGLEDGRISVFRERCSLCGKCVANCPSKAMHMSGEWMEAEPLFHRLLMDEKYYRQSGGGVTFSGGEPSIHAEFLLELLPKLHQQRIHTALETCGFCEEERFVRLASQCDLLLFDVKHMDAARHREGCGVDNRHILSNLERAARITDVIIRIPLIPSFNDDQENLLQTAKLASRLNIGHMQLLPFHRLGTHKYTELDRSYAYAGEQPLDAERVAQTAEWLAQESGLRVTVG